MPQRPKKSRPLRGDFIVMELSVAKAEKVSVRGRGTQKPRVVIMDRGLFWGRCREEVTPLNDALRTSSSGWYATIARVGPGGVDMAGGFRAVACRLPDLS